MCQDCLLTTKAPLCKVAVCWWIFSSCFSSMNSCKFGNDIYLQCWRVYLAAGSWFFSWLPLSYTLNIPLSSFTLWLGMCHRHLFCKSRLILYPVCIYVVFCNCSYQNYWTLTTLFFKVFFFFFFISIFLSGKGVKVH